MPVALEELTVLDLSSHLSATPCATLLGDRGADVIESERPGEDGEGAPFMFWSRKKRSLQLDLKAADAWHSFRALVDGAYVLIENFCSGALSKDALISLPHELSRYPKSSQQRQAA
jgi:crotonobetainyl-CoA:carnitine CoA-transferase CaiB-like acyl-CoA transferase